MKVPRPLHASLLHAALVALLTGNAATLLTASSLTFDADPATPGLQAGIGNWHAPGIWWDGSSNLDWSDGADATIPAGSEARLSQSAEVGDITLEGQMRVSNCLLTITGGAGGGGTALLEAPTSTLSGAGLEFTASTTVAWTIRGVVDYNRNLPVTVRGTGVELVFDGFWDHTGGGNRATANAFEGATFTFGPNAVVNNQLPSWNAREFKLRGDTTGRFVFDPGFSADMGGSATNPIGGLSVYRVEGVTLVTQATDSLPHIWKGAEGGIKHHGGIKMFGPAPQRWIVTHSAQYFDGGVAWWTDWTLETQVDLRHTPEGRFETNLDDGWGPNWGVTENTTMYKTGPASLILEGDHAYPPGSRYLIEEGAILMHTDPAYAGDHPNPAANLGPYLQVELVNSGAIHFLPPSGDTFGLASILASDTSHVVVGDGHLDLTGNLTLGADTRLTLAAGSVFTASPRIAVAGAADLAGTLELSESGGATWQAGTYPLFQYGSLAGLSLTLDTGSIALASTPGFTATLQDNPAQQQVELVLAVASPSGTDLATWQGFHFSPTEIAAGLAELNIDNEPDSHTNILEFAAVGDPHAREQLLTVQVAVDEVIVDFHRNPGATGITLSLLELDPDSGEPIVLGQSVDGGAFSTSDGDASVVETVEAGNYKVEVTIPVRDRGLFLLEASNE